MHAYVTARPHVVEHGATTAHPCFASFCLSYDVTQFVLASVSRVCVAQHHGVDCFVVLRRARSCLHGCAPRAGRPRRCLAAFYTSSVRLPDAAQHAAMRAPWLRVQQQQRADGTPHVCHHLFQGRARRQRCDAYAAACTPPGVRRRGAGRTGACHAVAPPGVPCACLQHSTERALAALRRAHSRPPRRRRRPRRRPARLG